MEDQKYVTPKQDIMVVRMETGFFLAAHFCVSLAQYLSQSATMLEHLHEFLIQTLKIDKLILPVIESQGPKILCC